MASNFQFRAPRGRAHSSERGGVRGCINARCGFRAQTRRWRKADSNRWSHLTYDGDAFQNTHSASPGCTAPEDGPAEAGMRSRQPF
jgi:hypothetical protein